MMAGLQESQIPLMCQLCEESNQIKWKCLQCNFLLCTKCKNIHKKVKSSDQHNIVDIKDTALYQQSSETDPDYGHIKCKNHEGQNCCLFCKECEEVVCPLCIAKTHNKHNMIEIKEGYKSSLMTLKTLNIEHEQNMKKLAKDMIKLNFIKTSESSNFEKEMQKIQNQGNVLKHEVDKYTCKLVNDLEQRWNISKKMIDEDETLTKKLSQDLESRNKKVTEALNSNDANNIFGTIKEEKKAMNQSIKGTVNTYKRLPEFVQGEITISTIESFHGKLQNAGSRKIEFEVMEKYVTSLPIVYNVVCCADKTLWINNYDCNTLQNITRIDGSLKVNNIVRLPVHQMVSMPNGDLLLSTLEPDLQICSQKTGQVQKSQYSVAPLQTIAVHVSKDSKILVGARERGPILPVKGPRQVIMMDLDGRKENVYQYDSKNQPLFTIPRRIITDNYNNIYVIDCMSLEFDGRVVVLGQNGMVRWIYTGYSEKQTNKGNRFRPTDIVFLELYNVVVSDQDNHMLHILDTEGQCIQYLMTKDLGIKLPFSLNIDNEGFLIIGCNRYTENKEGAKMFVIKYVKK